MEVCQGRADGSFALEMASEDMRIRNAWLEGEDGRDETVSHGSLSSTPERQIRRFESALKKGKVRRMQQRQHADETRKTKPP